MANEFVDGRCARYFWLYMGLFSLITLTVAVGSLSLAAEDLEKIFKYAQVYSCFAACVGGFLAWNLYRTPPAVTYETGRTVRTIFQIGVLYLMFFPAYFYPKPEVVAISVALMAGSIAVAQLAYPAQDFHVGHALLTVIGGLYMSCFGASVDPSRGDSVYFVGIWSVPWVLMALFVNYPRESAYVLRKY